tara:strand:+ start:622 stop:2286 length:1665 start_codon:yes stop_codon:yes gene_type:complete
MGAAFSATNQNIANEVSSSSTQQCPTANATNTIGDINIVEDNVQNCPINITQIADVHQSCSMASTLAAIQDMSAQATSEAKAYLGEISSSFVNQNLDNLVSTTLRQKCSSAGVENIMGNVNFTLKNTNCDSSSGQAALNLLQNATVNQQCVQQAATAAKQTVDAEASSLATGTDFLMDFVYMGIIIVVGLAVSVVGTFFAASYNKVLGAIIGIVLAAGIAVGIYYGYIYVNMKDKVTSDFYKDGKEPIPGWQMGSYSDENDENEKTAAFTKATNMKRADINNTDDTDITKCGAYVIKDGEIKLEGDDDNKQQNVHMDFTAFDSKETLGDWLFNCQGDTSGLDPCTDADGNTFKDSDGNPVLFKLSNGTCVGDISKMKWGSESNLNACCSTHPCEQNGTDCSGCYNEENGIKTCLGPKQPINNTNSDDPSDSDSANYLRCLGCTLNTTTNDSCVPINGYCDLSSGTTDAKTLGGYYSDSTNINSFVSCNQNPAACADPKCGGTWNTDCSGVSLPITTLSAGTAVQNNNYSTKSFCVFDPNNPGEITDFKTSCLAD